VSSPNSPTPPMAYRAGCRRHRTHWRPEKFLGVLPRARVRPASLMVITRDLFPQKLERFRLREAHRPLARSKNQKKCGRVRIKSEVEVSRRLDQDEGGAHFHGLVRCGSWSACPVCSAAIAARRGQEIEEAIRNHQENGGEVLLVTVTLRHHKGHSLKELMDVLGDSWRYMKAGGSWQGGKRRRDGTQRVGWKERIGYVGAIGGTESTHGNEYGWHPHKHVLFLLEKPIPNEVLQAFLRFLRERVMPATPRRRTRSHEVMIQGSPADTQKVNNCNPDGISAEHGGPRDLVWTRHWEEPESRVCFPSVPKAQLPILARFPGFERL